MNKVVLKFLDLLVVNNMDLGVYKDLANTKMYTLSLDLITLV